MFRKKLRIAKENRIRRVIQFNAAPLLKATLVRYRTMMIAR